MNHTRQLLKTGSLLTAALISAGLLSGCRPAPAKPTHPDASASAAREANPSAPASTSSAPPVYKPVRDPCTVIDHQLLSSTFGPRGADAVPPRTSTIGPLAHSWCNPTYGSATDRTLV